DLKRYEEAIGCYLAALNIDPHIGQVKGDLLHATAQVCDWTHLEELWSAVLADLRAGRGTQPMPVMATPASAADLLSCAQLYDRLKNHRHSTPLFSRRPR